MPRHRKWRATMSGGLRAPPAGSLFPLPRGVGNARRCAHIAFASPPAKETENAILRTTEL